MTINRRVLSLGGALIGLTLLAAILSLVVASIGGSSVAAQTDDTERTVTVSGNGQVSITPDTAVVTLGVEINDPDLGTAQTNAAQRMEAVIAAMKAAGIAEADITTSNYNVWVNTDYEKPEQPILGYHISHTVTVKVRNIDQVGAIIETGIEAGANTVQGVYFTVEDPGNAVSEARELAIADARAKAEDLARITGVTLGAVVTIDEYSYSPYPVSRAESDSYAGDAAAAMAPPINPGSSTVSVQVQVSWAIN
jgi:uncharacterized protein YggE